ncbi:Beta-galactosidase-1-like protein [Dermatophagoides pteronyssinus]|uniref:Beta-galactosidase n=1 Tax=Dermatophagoides pteronyssinus TaxID=6956 RepID=A0ABQ8IT83_DERPT|nr:Beta-galactosidase-1-like protein [Dermatophagoides pteronyssinus]
MIRRLFLFFSIFVFVLVTVTCQTTTTTKNNSRTFIVDYPNDRFLKDGQPFRYVSGSIHYFRVPKQYWQDRLKKMRSGGLNAIQTYVEWSSHEPMPGQYDFDGQNNLIEFIRLAQTENLLVILRVGPYICAERDLGGLPFWLLREPNITLRTSDPRFLRPVNRWLEILLPKIRPLLYENGGPIIMLQVENEYGSYGCDLNYTIHLRDKFREILGHQVVLFTTDGNGDGYLRCGHIPHVLTTIDFGSGTNVTKAKQTLYRHQEFGPFINSEYYSGWLDYWQSNFNFVNVNPFIETLQELLDNNASVNIYMYHGGSNFDFKASGNGGDENYQPTLTSYDYDAPINEAGDLNEKYFAIRDLIAQYLPTDSIDERNIKAVSEKMSLPPINMTFVATIFDLLPFLANKTLSKYPLTFEQVNQAYGFLLYQTNLTFHPTNPAILSVPGLRDRAHVFVDQRFAGILSRTQKYFNLSILAHNGSELSILVENQGRCSYGCINEHRGIIGNVTVNHKHLLINWTIYNLPFDEHSFIDTVTQLLQSKTTLQFESNYYRIPSIYIANFTLPKLPGYPLDTFLQTNGWSKGVAFLNNHNLGRYWPVAGPQITVYAPGPYFNRAPNSNEIILFELDESPCWYDSNNNCQIQFVKQHIVNGTYAN